MTCKENIFAAMEEIKANYETMKAENEVMKRNRDQFVQKWKPHLSERQKRNDLPAIIANLGEK